LCNVVVCAVAMRLEIQPMIAKMNKKNLNRIETFIISVSITIINVSRLKSKG
jgi:hypothetical protein